MAAHEPSAEEGLMALKLAHEPALRRTGDLHLLPLRAESEGSVAEAVRQLRAAFGEGPSLTHIVHCASAAEHDGWELAAVDGAAMARALKASAVSAVLVAKHLLPLTTGRVARCESGGPLPVLALVGIGTGRPVGSVGGGYALRASTAAYTAVAQALAAELRGRVAVVHLEPGHVRCTATSWRGSKGAPEVVAAMLGSIEAASGSLGEV